MFLDGIERDPVFLRQRCLRHAVEFVADEDFAAFRRQSVDGAAQALDFLTGDGEALRRRVIGNQVSALFDIDPMRRRVGTAMIDRQVAGNPEQEGARVVDGALRRGEQVAHEDFLRQLGRHLDAGQPPGQEAADFSDVIDVQGGNRAGHGVRGKLAGSKSGSRDFRRRRALAPATYRRTAAGRAWPVCYTARTLTRRPPMDHSHAHGLAVFSYSLAFMTGLLGSGHCLGMCGGLVSAFFMRLKARGIWPYLAYHGARLGVYASVGLIAAGLGAVLVQTGSFGKWQGVLQIVAGLVVILLGLDLLGVSPLRNSVGFAPLAWLRRQFGLATEKGPLLGAAIGGAINGLMPCSMTMAMAVKATTAPSIVEGGLLMLAFGAGTLPAMLSASVLFGKLGPKVRGWLLKGAALFVIALGVSTLWQGIDYYLVMRKLLG